MHDVPGAIYRCRPDDDWSMAIIGDEIERITGHPAQEYVDGVRTYASVIHPDDREYVRCEVDDVVVTGVLGERPRAPVESALYFTVAEALTNCAKHAAADAVRVTIGDDAGCVEVVVRDDGCGGADTESGSGLRGIVDRIEALGGTVEVTSPAGEGTALRVRVPR